MTNDALEVNDGAVKILGDDILRAINCTVIGSVRANLRRMVKRVLKQHGYPPDRQEKAVQTVLEQAEILCEHWAA